MRKNRKEEARKTVEHITAHISHSHEEASYIAEWLSCHGYNSIAHENHVLVGREYVESLSSLRGLIEMALDSAVEKIPYERFIERIVNGYLDGVFFNNDLELTEYVDNSDRTVHLSDSCDFIIINYHIDWNIEQKGKYSVKEILELIEECTTYGCPLQVNRMIINLRKVACYFICDNLYLFRRDNHTHICTVSISDIEFMRILGDVK